MHARVVRFTDVSSEAIANIVSRIEANDGPPEGVESTGMKLLHDSDQSTAVFIAFFADEEKLRAADAIFEQMDSGDTPGTRASIDRCEVAIERDS